MKTIFTSFIAFVLMIPMGIGQNNVEVSAGDNWIGFMNVFNLNGGYEFGSAWEVPVLKSSLDLVGNTVTLQPNFNTYADNPTDPFWVDQATGEGNKVMEALTFVEPGATFNGADLTFFGSVQSYTLDSAYTVKYFIKALDPNDGFADALGGAGVFDLPESGNFSVTITGDQLPAGLVIQYGFSVEGRNANPANEATLGNVVVGAGTTSVADINDALVNVKVYPNPAADILRIDSDSKVNSYQISTLLGQTVVTGKADNEIDVSNLRSGNYFITLQLEAGQKTIKFSKQ